MESFFDGLFRRLEGKDESDLSFKLMSFCKCVENSVKFSTKLVLFNQIFERLIQFFPIELIYL